MGCAVDLKETIKKEYKKYLRSVRDRGMDFPVNKREWRKVINFERLENDYSLSDAIPPSIGKSIILQFFLLLTIPYMPCILVSLNLSFLSIFHRDMQFPLHVLLYVVVLRN